MLGALLLGLARGMERVGEQEERGDQVWLFSTEHAGLASAIGMTAQEEAAGNHSSYGGEGVLQTGAVARGVTGAGWAEGPGLAIGKIAAQDGEAIRAESFGQGYEERGLCIRAGSVRKDQAVAVGSLRREEVTADSGFGGVIGEIAGGGRGQDIILNRG
jgi:hypothetical protein